MSTSQCYSQDLQFCFEHLVITKFTYDRDRAICLRGIVRLLGIVQCEITGQLCCAKADPGLFEGSPFALLLAPCIYCRCSSVSYRHGLFATTVLFSIKTAFRSLDSLVFNRHEPTIENQYTKLLLK
jgi:hypothetical protein